MKIFTLYLLILVTLLHQTNTTVHHKRLKNTHSQLINVRNEVLGTGQETKKKDTKDKLMLADKTNKDQLPETEGAIKSNYKLESTAFVNPSMGSKVIEPIGYEATGMNYQQTPAQREMDKRPVSGSESFDDENEFIKDASSSPPFASDAGTVNDDSGYSTTSSVVEDDTQPQQQAAQHGQIGGKIDKIVEDAASESFDLQQQQAIQHDQVGGKTDKIAEDAVSESFAEKPEVKSVLTGVIDWLKGLFNDNDKKKNETKEETKTKEELEEEEKLKAKLLEALKEEHAKEELKKAAGEIHKEAVEESFPPKEKTNKALKKQEEKEKEIEDEKEQKLKIQEKLANEKVRLQEQESLQKLHAMAINAAKTRQKLIDDLIKNGTLLGDKSRDEIESWIKNITGIDIDDTTLNSTFDDIDLMSLNQDYFVHHPPNHVLFNLHRPMKNPITYHVTTNHGGHMVHHYDHFYNSKPAHLSVNHYVTKVKPCLNGGVVIPYGHGDVECICKNGFYGAVCEDFDYCFLNPCKNRGKCYPIDNAPRIHCTCLRQYFGKLCEKKNPCFDHKCQNGGSCTHDGEGKAECVCKSGYNGNKCQYVDSCVPSPCINGGTCHPVNPGNFSGGNFTCECPIQFKGPICQFPTICVRHPCNNGGVCRETDTDEGFQCICPIGFIGKTCDERPCTPNPCLNGATCAEEGSNATCICTKWAKGERCETVSPCSLKPCGTNGYCIDSESGYSVRMKALQYFCICKPPFMGPGCLDNICNHCSPNGHCVNKTQCVCDEGFVGDGIICSENMTDLCKPNPCKNEGVCMMLENGEFKCRCKPPFKGELCEVLQPCVPDPCENGYCEGFKDGTLICHCTEGYSGPTCNITEPCIPNPCQHGGSCKTEAKKAKCKCLGEWTGPVCKDCNCPKSKDINLPDTFCNEIGKCQCYGLNGKRFEFSVSQNKCYLSGGDGTHSLLGSCDPNPCKNGATCTPDGELYTCKCTKWFFGKNCSTLRTCIPNNPCLNGGSCKDNEDGSFTCDCPPNTVPPKCSAKPISTTITPNTHCTPNPCLNDGLCKTLFDGYDCICKPRFTGPNCQVDRCKDCDSEHAHCVLGHCKCNAGYIGNGYECKEEDSPMPVCGRCPLHAYCLPSSGHCSCRTGFVYSDDQCVVRGSIPLPTRPSTPQRSQESTIQKTSTTTTTTSTTARPPVENSLERFEIVPPDELKPTDGAILMVTKSFDTFKKLDLKPFSKSGTTESLKKEESPVARHRGFAPIPYPEMIDNAEDDEMGGPPSPPPDDAVDISNGSILEDNIQ